MSVDLTTATFSEYLDESRRRRSVDQPDLTFLLRRSIQLLESERMATRLTPEERKDREMSEKTLYNRVRYRLKKRGWKGVHFTQAMVGGSTEDGGSWATPVGGDAKGFPDLVLVKAGHPLAFAELKRELGRIEPDQAMWISLLRDLGHQVFVWRPSDLRLGRIEAFLDA